MRIAFENLIHICKRLELGQALLDSGAEVGLTELGDNVGIVLCGVYFMEGEHMRHILH